MKLSSILVCIPAFVAAWVLAAQPALNVGKQGTNVVVSWLQTNSTNFVLQRTPTLLQSNSWFEVGTTPILASNRWSVSLAPTNNAAFFRLFLAASNIVDDPDDQFIDSNGDGVDGNATNAVFVSTTGGDAAPGTMAQPVRTLAQAISKAKLLGKPHVYAASGVYTSTNIVLSNGVSIYGGYHNVTWARSGQNLTRFIATLPIAVLATNITNSTTIDRLTIESANATNASQSAYGIFAMQSPGLIVRYCTIIAGKGANGPAGGAGDTGPNGGNGGNGSPGCEDSTPFCDTCPQPSGGLGGVSACGRTGGVGGLPGKGTAPGTNGAAGAGGTLGGSGATCGGSPACDGTPGGEGATGANGSDGSAGVFGIFTFSGYTPMHGTNGSVGGNGDGGGGGGGGGGGDDDCDSYGSSGGGGGAGGCGGTPGGGGQSAGASVGIFLWNSSSRIEFCSIQTIGGGNGGAGGAGGLGGTGGLGGNGGIYGGFSEQDDGGDGAKGGKGGDGGRGGHGGGGAGGPSIGIVKAGTSTPQISSNTYTLGSGGTGGQSNGQAGPTGLVANVHP